MVMINYDCMNYPAEKDSSGGARCICPKCQKERAEQSPQAEQATASCLSELLADFMQHREFTMSMFLNAEDLFKAKAEYYQEACIAAEKSLEAACKIGFSDDCPLHNVDIEPWEEPCSDVCEKYQGEGWKCWAKYFSNMSS